MNSQYKILYVEDEESLREIIAELITAEGYQCKTVADGQEAKETLEKESFDLLITDFNMPRMNGAELLFWCRANDLHFPVIFLTANVERLPHEEMALGDCCSALLQKPISFEILLESINQAKKRNHDFDCHGKINLKSTPEKGHMFHGQHFFDH